MHRETGHILEDILETIADSDSPQQSLDLIVQIIAERFITDVCSVYVYDPYGNTLLLKATEGLKKESVGTIEMDVNEGLTGLVIETMAPVFIIDPSTHPRYKYYADSGEEAYKTYLGLPLIYHKKILGALVVQTLDRQGISEKDISLFTNIANQIAPTVAFTILQENSSPIDSKEIQYVISGQPRQKEKAVKQSHLRGDPVSDRVAAGYAYYMIDTMDFDQIHSVHIDDVESEIHRLEKAFLQSAEQIKQVAGHAKGISDQDKTIIEAHLMYLSDASLITKIAMKIKGNVSA